MQYLFVYYCACCGCLFIAVVYLGTVDYWVGTLSSLNAVYWANHPFAVLHTQIRGIYGNEVQDTTKAIEIDPR